MYEPNEPKIISILEVVENTLSKFQNFSEYAINETAKKEKDIGFAMVLQAIFYFGLLPIFLLVRLLLYLLRKFLETREN